MIELLQIFLQLFIFTFLTSFPINKYSLELFNIKNKFNFFHFLSINSLILFLLLLLFSFIKIDLLKIFFIIIFFHLTILIIIRKYIFFSKLNILQIFFFFLSLSIFINTTNNLELGWDGFAWKQKANFFYNGGFFFDIYKFENVYSNYPHLGTYLWAFFWKNTLLNYEYLGRLFYSYIYLLSLFTIASSFYYIKNFHKILIVLLIFFFTYDKTLEGYQDYIIFYILNVFFIFLICNYYDQKNKLFYLVFCLTGVLLPWVKLEGMIYTIFIIIIFCYYEFGLKKNKLSFIYSLIFFLISFSLLSKILIFKFLLNEKIIFQFNLEFSVFKAPLSEYISKTYYIIFYSVVSFFKYPIWLLNILGLLISFKNYKKNDVFKIFNLFFFLNTIFIFFTFFMSPADIKWHLATALDRLYLQTSGIYFTMFIIIFKNKIYPVKFY